ncbi:MAG TPA: DUF5675 family protein [Candidatus Saccharimonadales bacterium]|nr:DUF5675 family protein [Candidatus Saccharimonadales bacterium]
MLLTLTRDAPRPDCQEGILNVGGSQYYTIERPWKDNHAGISCVLAGQYDLIPHVLEHGALLGLKCYALSNPDLGVFLEPPAGYTGPNAVRVAILIHPANLAFQLLGCIAPGKSRGLLTTPDGTQQPAVLQSRDAFDEIMGILGVDVMGHQLLIQ